MFNFDKPAVAGLIFGEVKPFTASLIYGTSSLIWWGFMFLSIWFRLTWTDQYGVDCPEPPKSAIGACKQPMFPMSLDMMPDKIFFWGSTGIWGLTLFFFLIALIPAAAMRFMYWLVVLLGAIIGPLSGFWVVLVWYIMDYSLITDFTGSYTIPKIFLHTFLLFAWFLFMTLFSSEMIDPIWRWYWILADRAVIVPYERPDENMEDLQYSERFADPVEYQLNSFILEF